MARVKLAGSFRFIKFTTYLFTFLFLLFGIVVFAIGIKVRASSSFINLNDNHTGANLLIFVGLVMICTSTIGFCGALRENQCMLAIYFVTLLFIFMLLMSAGLWASAYKSKLKFRLRKFLGEKIADYNNPAKSKKSKEYLDNLQDTMKCCGVDGHFDYTKNVPLSCGKTVFERNSRIGCIEAMSDFFRSNLNRIVGLGITMALIMLFGMAFSITLCCAIREAERLMN